MCLPLLALLPAGAAAAGGTAAAAGTAAAIGAGAATTAGAFGATAGLGASLAATGGIAGASAATAASAGILGTGLTAAQLVSLGGTVLSAGSAIAGGIAQKQEAKTGKKLAQREAVVAATANTLERQAITKRQRQLASKQNAQAGKSGRTFSGSILDVVQDSNQNAEFDILSSVYGGGVSAARNKGNINIAKAGGKGALATAGISAGSTLLTGGAKLF